MDDTGTSSRSKRRRAVAAKQVEKVDSNDSVHDQQEECQQCGNLLIENDALYHALCTAEKTISDQNDLVSDLRLKVASQLPKLIELRLDAMGKVIEQLYMMFDETKALLSNGPSSFNVISLPVDIRTLATDTTLEKHLEAIENECMAEPEVPLPAIEDSPAKKKRSSNVKPSRKKLKVLPAPKKVTPIKIKTEPTEHPTDELMNLPASTSKTTPRLARKRVGRPPKATPSRRKSERAVQIETQNKSVSSEDDEEEEEDDVSLERKRQRLKIKLQPPVKPVGKKRSRNDDSSVSPTSERKRTSSKTVKDHSSDLDVRDDEGDFTKKTLTLSSTRKSDTVLSISSIPSKTNVAQTDSVKPPTPPLLNSKRKAASKASTKINNSRKSKTKSRSSRVKEADAAPDKEPKVNGVVSEKSKASKSSSFEALFNSVINGTEEKVNGELKAVNPCTTSSINLSDWPRVPSVEMIKNFQPQVILTDIFLNSPDLIRSITSKVKGDLLPSNKPESPAAENEPIIEEPDDKLSFSDVDENNMPDFTVEIPSLDLELECISDDAMDPLGTNKETSLPLNPPAASSILGLNENMGVSPGFGCFQNCKDRDSSPEKSLDNEINLGPLEKLLAKVCNDNFNKDYETDDRLVFTYS